MATVRSIAAASLRRIGVLAEGETPTASQAADALESLNALLDQWAAERLQVPVVLRTRLPLASGVGGYRLAPVTADAETSENFDLVTGVGVPAGWSGGTTSGTTQIETTPDATANTPPNLLRMSTVSTGSALIYRDIVCVAGLQCNVSIWMGQNASVPTDVLGTFRVQNLDTGLYLSPDGTWGTTAVDLFEAANAGAVPPLVHSQLSFYLDPAAMLGDTLRCSILFSNGTAGDFCDYDSFSLTNYADRRERPVFVDHVNIIDGDSNSGLEIPINQATDAGWASLRMKEQQSALPSGWYYNPTFPYGSLHFWPVPNRGSLTAIVYAGYPITKFGSTTATFYLPPGYERMIVTNLALELAPEYNAKPSDLLVRQATESMAAVKVANFKMVDLGFEAAALIGGHFGPRDIRTGP